MSEGESSVSATPSVDLERETLVNSVCISEILTSWLVVGAESVLCGGVGRGGLHGEWTQVLLDETLPLITETERISY